MENLNEHIERIIEIMGINPIDDINEQLKPKNRPKVTSDLSKATLIKGSGRGAAQSSVQKTASKGRDNNVNPKLKQRTDAELEFLKLYDEKELKRAQEIFKGYTQSNINSLLAKYSSGGNNLSKIEISKIEKYINGIGKNKFQRYWNSLSKKEKAGWILGTAYGTQALLLIYTYAEDIPERYYMAIPLIGSLFYNLPKESKSSTIIKLEDLKPKLVSYLNKLENTTAYGTNDYNYITSAGDNIVSFENTSGDVIKYKYDPNTDTFTKL